MLFGVLTVGPPRGPENSLSIEESPLAAFKRGDESNILHLNKKIQNLKASIFAMETELPDMQDRPLQSSTSILIQVEY